MRKKISLLICMMTLLLLSNMAVYAANCSHAETYSKATGSGWSEDEGGWVEISTYCKSCDDRVDVKEVKYEESSVSFDGYGADLSYSYWDREENKWKTGESKQVVDGNGNTLDPSIGNPEVSIEYELSGEFVKIKKNPVREDAAFEGWAKFKYVLGEDDIYEKVFVPKSKNSPYYTLEEMLATKASGENTLFAAKWSGIEIDDYYKEVFVDVQGYEGDFSYAVGYYDDDYKLKWDEYDFGGFGTTIQVGKSFNSSQDALFKIIGEPTKEGAEFEGWARFRVENGEYYFEPKNEDNPYYTTNEMMNASTPNYSIVYNPKWSDIAIEDYYAIGVNYYSWILDAGKGTIHSKYTYDEEVNNYKENVSIFGLKEELTFKEALDDNDCEIVEIKKNHAILDSWTLYEIDYLDVRFSDDGKEPELSKGERIIYSDTPIPDEPEYRRYFVTVGEKLWKKGVSTKALYKMDVDRSVYAVAKWDDSTKTTTKKATLKENGKIVTKCTDCGKVLKEETIYRPKEFKLSTVNYIYNGNAKKPTVTVKDSKGKKLVKDTDYSVSYEKGRTKVGIYKVTITFKGKYEGTKSLEFYISPKNPSSFTTKLSGYDDIKVSWKKCVGASGYYVYYKKSSDVSFDKKKVKATTKDTQLCTLKDLKPGTKYIIMIRAFYEEDKEEIYYGYTDTKSLYTLKKVSTPKVSKSGTKVKVSWTNISGESGYQIYKMTKSGSKYKKVDSYTTSNASKTITATKGKTYYYKVRAYKTVDGEKIYGPWSKEKSYKRK